MKKERTNRERRKRRDYKRNEIMTKKDKASNASPIKKQKKMKHPTLCCSETSTPV